MIFDVLFAKTFLLVGFMLIITTITTRINKEYETTIEAILTFFGSFLFLFLVTFFSDIFPLNIFLVACFSGIIGWSLGPTITSLGKNFKLRRFLKKRNIQNKKDPENKSQQIYYTESKEGEMKILTIEQRETLFKDFEKEIEKGGDPYHKKWQNIVYQAMLGTTIAVFASSSLVFLSDIDFSFLGLFLFIALLLLIILSLLNQFIFRSPFISLLKAYFGVVIFTLYLLYDFNRLEALMAEGDTSWSTAIDIAVNLYLDIINLFLDLLQILAGD